MQIRSTSPKIQPKKLDNSSFSPSRPRQPLHPLTDKKPKPCSPEPDFQTGSFTLFQISQLALQHNIRMMVPPSILLNFSIINKDGAYIDRSRLMYTDGVSGYLRVVKKPEIKQDEM